MSILSALAVVAMVLASLLIGALALYCGLYPIAGRAAERDAFCDPDKVKAAEANRRRYTVFGTLK